MAKKTVCDRCGAEMPRTGGWRSQKDSDGFYVVVEPWWLVGNNNAKRPDMCDACILQVVGIGREDSEEATK